MIELNDFYNDGTGWRCRRCERELAVEAELESSHSRFFREGEAESKFPQLSSPAMAKWFDAEHETLICPRCGLIEKANLQ